MTSARPLGTTRHTYFATIDLCLLLQRLENVISIEGIIYQINSLCLKMMTPRSLQTLVTEFPKVPPWDSF